MFRTKHLKLTKDQKNRGVVYSTRLINYSIGDAGKLHEVIPAQDPQWREHLRNLQDVKFFKDMANDFNWNVVNEIRS